MLVSEPTFRCTMKVTFFSRNLVRDALQAGVLILSLRAYRLGPERW